VAVAGWIFISALIAATFIDLDHFIIPDEFTIGLGILGVFLSVLIPALHGHEPGEFALGSLRAGADSVQGLLIGAGLVFWVAVVAEALLKKEAMGFGDVKFVGAIGAFCGWEGAVFAMFGGAVVGTVWFALAWLWERMTGKKSVAAPPSETPEGQPTELAFGAHVPFGPMLAIAGAFYFLAGKPFVQAWLDDVKMLF
jgi:leader peptidase (prepilin peptidase)/N-methyltransferase